MQQNYVAGFMFSEDLNHVALIKKNRPAWQKGLFNGIGGHVEDTDASLEDAMAREFEEEAGYYNSYWRKYARISKDGLFSVTFFFTVGDLNQIKTTTDEEVIIANVGGIAKLKTIENLPWLIPLALDCMNDGRPDWAEINYPKAKKHEQT